MQTKFEIGETLYVIGTGNEIGKVDSITITENQIMYGFSFSNWLEYMLTNEEPKVTIQISRKDLISLTQFFGDMNMLDYDDIVADQVSSEDISTKVVGDLPFRLYLLFNSASKQK